MRIPIQVLVYPVRYKDDKWEFLLLRRIESRGGFWQGVTGHTERRERLIDGAKRELLEETSFVPNFIFQTNFSYTIPLDEKNAEAYPPGTKEIPEHVFITRIDHTDNPTLDPLEHNDWKWCSFDEALDLLFWETNKEALIYCNNFLTEEK